MSKDDQTGELKQIGIACPACKVSRLTISRIGVHTTQGIINFECVCPNCEFEVDMSAVEIQECARTGHSVCPVSSLFPAIDEFQAHQLTVLMEVWQEPSPFK